MYDHSEMTRLFLDSDSAENSDLQVKNGLFPDWMVFVLFSPYGPLPRYEIPWIQESPSSKSAKARKQYREETKKDRASSYIVPAERKGESTKRTRAQNISMDHQIMVASIAQREYSDARQDQSNQVMEQQMRIQNELQQKMLVIEVMKMKGGSSSSDFESDLLKIAAHDSMISYINQEIIELKTEFKKLKQSPVVIDLIGQHDDVSVPTDNEDVSSRCHQSS